MARPSNNYDPNNYGNSFERLPEGVHAMGIISGEITYGRNSGAPQWLLVLQPSEQRYQSKNGFKLWLEEEGCVNALFDAGGANPSSVPDRDFQPQHFVGKKVYCEIVHRPSKDDPSKIFANIQRLHPAWSMKNISQTCETAEFTPVKPAEVDPFPADAFDGGEEIPF